MRFSQDMGRNTMAIPAHQGVEVQEGVPQEEALIEEVPLEEVAQVRKWEELTEVPEVDKEAVIQEVVVEAAATEEAVRLGVAQEHERLFEEWWLVMRNHNCTCRCKIWGLNCKLEITWRTVLDTSRSESENFHCHWPDKFRSLRYFDCEVRWGFLRKTFIEVARTKVDQYISRELT